MRLDAAKRPTGELPLITRLELSPAGTVCGAALLRSPDRRSFP
jgi:hypothetical protein